MEFGLWNIAFNGRLENHKGGDEDLIVVNRIVAIVGDRCERLWR
jgi:hypothetical protein